MGSHTPTDYSGAPKPSFSTTQRQSRRMSVSYTYGERTTTIETGEPNSTLTVQTADIPMINRKPLITIDHPSNQNVTISQNVTLK